MRSHDLNNNNQLDENISAENSVTDLPAVTLDDIHYTQGKDTLINPGKLIGTLALKQAQRESFFATRPKVKHLLMLESPNPVLREAPEETANGEFYFTYSALALLIDKKIRQHPTHNTNNVFLINNNPNQLIDTLTNLNLATDEDAKFIYINQIHKIPFYIRNIGGNLHCFIVDSEITEKGCIILRTIGSVLPKAKIIISTTLLQKDFFSCSIFSIKALMYFVKHGEEIFSYIEKAGTFAANGYEKLAPEKLMPTLLKMCQTTLTLPDEVLNTVVSHKRNLTLREYLQTYQWRYAKNGKLFNAAALIKRYGYFNKLHTYLALMGNNELASAELGDVIKGKFSLYGFDYVIYKKIYEKLMIIAKDTVQTEIALIQVCAAKLAILFNDSEMALKYVNHYIQQDLKRAIPHLHLVDAVIAACAFELPDNDQWNIGMWRAIVYCHNVSFPNDLILRLLPFAPQIETHVKLYHDKLVARIKEKVIEEFRNKFAREYDSLEIYIQDREGADRQVAEKHRIAMIIVILKKNIDKEVATQFDLYLLTKLNLPLNKKLHKEDRKLLEERKNNLNPTDLSKLDEIRQTIENNYTHVANNKEEFISKRLATARGEINANVKNKAANLLSKNTSAQDIFQYALPYSYKRFHENPKAAELFFRYGYSNMAFEQYLALHPQDDAQYIPDVTIDGSVIHPDYADYYLIKLDPFDPWAALLGKETSCCQSLNNGGRLTNGERLTAYGIESKFAGFYVFYKKMTNEPDQILAQTLAWRSGDELTFDSVESNNDFRNHNTNEIITDFYIYLAFELTTKHNILQVSVGAGQAYTKTPSNLGRFSPARYFHAPDYPYDYDDFADSEKTRIVAHKNLPLISLHKRLNPRSKLPAACMEPLDSYDAKSVTLWIDFCLHCRQEQWIEHIAPSITKQGLTAQVEQHITLTKQWIAQLQSDELDWQEVIYLLDKGVNPNFGNRKPSHRYLDYCKSHQIQIQPESIGYSAAAAEKWDVVEILIRDHDFAFNADKQQCYALLEYFQGNMENINKLIMLGTDINTVNVDGSTLVADAIRRTDWRAVKKLCRLGANLNISNEDDSNLVISEMRKSNWQSVHELLTLGANNNVKKVGYYNVIFTNAIANSQWDIVFLLITKFSDHTIPTVDYQELNNLIGYALKNNHTELLFKLKERGLDFTEILDREFIFGMSRLHLAVKLKKSAEVTVLIELGASVNIIEKRTGKTPLHYAVNEDDLESVQILLDHGARIDVTTNDNETALDLAMDGSEIYQLLKARMPSEPDQLLPSFKRIRLV